MNGRAFCTTLIAAGSPATFTEEYVHGLPAIKEYDGTNYCGISNETVIELADSLYIVGAIGVGGVVNLICGGTISVPNNLFTNINDLEFSRHIKPVKNGKWKVQKDRTIKSVGWIREVGKEYSIVVLH